MTEREFDPRTKSFLSRLEDLDPGERARLKRNAGRPLAESTQALGLFYHLLPGGVAPYHEETYFLVATLYPICSAGGDGNLGASLRRARTSINANGLDRRVEALIDADESQLPFRLRQAIRFLASNRVRVNYGALLEDLLRWNSPRRFVQQRWARSYFAEELKSDQGG